jgi:hypothetical protein
LIFDAQPILYFAAYNSLLVFADFPLCGARGIFILCDKLLAIFHLIQTEKSGALETGFSRGKSTELIELPAVCIYVESWVEEFSKL